jgi:hypothetical protein
MPAKTTPAQDYDPVRDAGLKPPLHRQHARDALNDGGADHNGWQADTD